MKNILFILVIVLMFLWVRKSGYNSQVKLMTANETNTFLKSDSDGFVAGLNRWDLFARRVSTPQEYIDKISKSGIDAQVSLPLLEKVDEVFRKKGDEKIANEPWIIAMTDGSYEEGFPHTRENIIFLTPESVSLNTLIHEKLHIYNRFNPPDLVGMGYKYLGPRKGTYRLRSNPDVDENIWEDPASGKPMVALYNSDRPMGLLDINIDSENEHPYEVLSYNYTKQ